MDPQEKKIIEIFVMSLIIDQQTLDDLNIFGKRDNDSVYAIFNRTHTRGGAEILEQMFRYPLSEITLIHNRLESIRYFRDAKVVFPFKSDLFDAAGQYLSNTDERSRLSHSENTLGRKFNAMLGADTEYQQVIKGIASLVEILIRLQAFISQSRPSAAGTPYADELEEIERLINIPEFTPLLQEKLPVKMDYAKAVEYDKLLRYVHCQRIQKILYHIYKLDVYISVATVAAQRGFIFPEAVESEAHIMQVEGVYHPRLTKPVANNLHMGPGGNIIFLTGANMAGKSTFMKALGIALFLAHVGFPVAAAEMVFSVCDGLLTFLHGSVACKKDGPATEPVKEPFHHF
jgi:DNA mismatch repair protein MutS